MTTTEERAWEVAATWATYTDRESVHGACLWASDALHRGLATEVYWADLCGRIRDWNRLPAVQAGIVEAYAHEYLGALGCTVADGSVRLLQGGAS